MRISIVIPVYNAEKYLRECVESALDQSYDNIEVIAVNDGSTDRSLKVLEEYSDKISIISKENGGTASALNTGIRSMKGEWFKWLSADDVLYPDAIEKLIAEAQKLKNTKNILYGSYDIIDSNSTVVRQFIEPNHNELTTFEISLLLHEDFIGNGSTSIIHKSTFDRYGMFDETVGYAEDYELWLRLCILHDFRLHLVSGILTKYRVHEANLTKTVFFKALRNKMKIRDMIMEKLDDGKRKRYKVYLKKIRQDKPLRMRLRIASRMGLVKILPEPISEKILRIYFKVR